MTHKSQFLGHQKATEINPHNRFIKSVLTYIFVKTFLSPSYAPTFRSVPHRVSSRTPRVSSISALSIPPSPCTSHPSLKFHPTTPRQHFCCYNFPLFLKIYFLTDVSGCKNKIIQSKIIINKNKIRSVTEFFETGLDGKNLVLPTGLD